MGAQIVVVDDDAIVGGLTVELLEEAGYATRWIQDSLKALEAIKAERPSLVILDILMPGLDGLTLLHRLKSDPETAGVRAIVVSGKSFEAERKRAAQYGAEDFIEKPYDVELFAARVGRLLAEKGARLSPPPAPAAPPRAALSLRVWGARWPGEGPSPEPTTCLSLETPSSLFILDAGTGLAELGRRLARQPRGEAWLLLSSLDPARAGGLPGWAPLEDPAFTLHLAAAPEPERALEESAAALLGPGAAPKASLDLYELMEKAYELAPGARLEAFYANHPGTALGFVLRLEGRRIAYCPAGEIYGDAATALQDYDEKLGGQVRGCDLLVHDARWTAEDYASRRNQGHSGATAVVELAARCGIRKLLLVGMDPSYSPRELDETEGRARARAAELGGAVDCRLARPGLELAL